MEAERKDTAGQLGFSAEQGTIFDMVLLPTEGGYEISYPLSLLLEALTAL